MGGSSGARENLVGMVVDWLVPIYSRASRVQWGIGLLRERWIWRIVIFGDFWRMDLIELA